MAYPVHMAKVRMSQKCAGGCGLWLVVGTHAAHLHRNWFCRDCAQRHLARCTKHRVLVG